MSQVNTNKNYLRHMGAASGTDRDAAAVGGIVSIWYGGFAIGALMVGTYADRIGRLKTIELGCLWGLVGAALQCTAQNITWMMFARIIGGIGCGHLNTVVPIWTSELADPHLRGAFVAVEFTLALTGSTIVYWMEYACTKLQTQAFAWRFPVGCESDVSHFTKIVGLSFWSVKLIVYSVQMVFLILVLVVVPFYPESPRHLAKQGKLTEARDILERCRVDPDPVKIDYEMERIKDALRLEASSAAANSFWSMLTIKDRFHTRRRIMLGGGVQIMQKFTGIVSQPCFSGRGLLLHFRR